MCSTRTATALVPYPAQLVEKREVLVDDEEDVWYEYVPESYDPSKKVPLVISNHGGLMTGWGQCIYTSWSYIADREGFIVIFPNAHRSRFWAVERDPNRPMGVMKLAGVEITPAPLDLNENKDVKFLLKLIDVMKERYSIGRGTHLYAGNVDGRYDDLHHRAQLRRASCRGFRLGRARERRRDPLSRRKNQERCRPSAPISSAFPSSMVGCLTRL